jgi:hypothetical protein
MFVPTRHFSPFKLFLDRPSGLALMLNPKVLTTFTRAMLTDGLAEFRGREDPSEGRYRLFSVARRFPMAPLSDYLGFFRDPLKYDLHAFVRNPYARIASAWRNKFLDGHTATPDGADAGYPRSVRQRHLKPIRRFARDAGLAGGETGQMIPFETFLHYAASRRPGSRDHHWESQTLVLMADRLDYARVWRIEDELALGFIEIGTRLDLPADWVMGRLAKPANPSQGKAPLYDEHLARLAEPLCGDDFHRFGYATDSWRTI